MDFNFGLLLGALKKRGSKKKYRKIPKENWFARLSVDDSKKLCRAAKMPVSGAKKTLIGRLLDSDTTCRYGAEARAASFSYNSFSMGKDGVSVDGLKEELKKRGLVQSGSKFELVLRLLQHEHGTGDAAAAAAATPKLAAAVETNEDGSPVLDGATGLPVLKKRKPNTAMPNLDKLRERVEKKVFAPDRSKWSDAKYKDHCGDVMRCAAGVVEKQALGKGFAAARDPVAVDVCAAVLEPVLEGWDGMTGQGRCNYDAYWLLLKVGEVLGEGAGGDGDATETSERREEVRALGAQLCSEWKSYCGSALEGEGIEMFLANRDVES